MKNLKPLYEKDADMLRFFILMETKKRKNKRFKEKDLVSTGWNRIVEKKYGGMS